MYSDSVLWFGEQWIICGNSLVGSETESGWFNDQGARMRLGFRDSIVDTAYIYRPPVCLPASLLL